MFTFKKSFMPIAISAIVMMTSVAPVQAAPFAPVPVERASDIVNVQQSWRDRDSRRYNDRRIIRNRGFYRQGNNGYYNGHRGYRDRRPGYRQHNGLWFPLGAFAAGAIIGGAIADRPVRYGGSHVGWCQNRYRSYRVSDNTYQPNNGPRRQCNSPY